MVKWLNVDGCIFFRESCFHQSGDSKRKYNPTHYREPRFYTKVCSQCNYYSLLVQKQLFDYRRGCHRLNLDSENVVTFILWR